MAATSAARASIDTGRFAFATATDRDDREIGALLRAAALPGDIRVSMPRDPSALAAATIEGETHQLIVARDRASGTLAGVAARSVRPLYVNGRVARVGYLGQLRVDPACRRLRGLIDGGFEFCRDLHRGEDPICYLTSIVAGNDAARRLLVDRRSRSAPRFVPFETLRTFVIPVRRPRPVHGVAGLRLEAGSQALIAEIAACLNRNLRRYQFAPEWTVEDLQSDRTRDLAPEHFVVALQDDRVVGCAARWDQRAFKQVVVRGYSPRLARWRPLVNLAGRWLNVPMLPAVGQTLGLAYVSHVAVDGDREDVLTALVAEQCRRARMSGLSHVVTAFVPGHPFHGAIARRFPHRAYESALYLACWPDAEHLVPKLDGRIAQPEVAVL